ncbi:MAG: PQQ-like beta-propeller repeat protein [Solirubrobacterales bacterium]|nr:PQQ-like beta-propeller repeat protein [Solirubrobacterales bacterium]
MLGKVGRCGLIVVALLWAGVVSAGPAVADVTDQSVAYQVDPAHDGWLQGITLQTPLQEGWSDTFGGDVSYPLVVNGTVYVTALPPGGDDSDLFALNQTTGKVLWQHDLGTGYAWSGLAYDGGRLFAVNSGGLLTAFDAIDGTIDWSRQLQGQYMFSSPPTAVGGIVYDGGAGGGGTLYANDEATGAMLWSQSVANGDNSSPAVDGSNVYVTYPDNYYAFNRVTGALSWLDALGGDGGGGRTPVVADGHVFIRDWTAPARIVSAAGGALEGPLGSTTAPAVANGIVYELDGSMLEAVPEDGLGPIAWTFSGDGQLDSAPLVIGSTVYVGSSSGELYAVDGVTGQQLWSTNVQSPILAPDEQNVSQPLTGMGAGGGSLLVSAGRTLVDYAGPEITTPTPGVPAPPATGTGPSPGTTSPASGASVGTSSSVAGTASSAVAQAAALRGAISPRARLGRIIARHGVQLTVQASGAGRMVVEWLYVPAGATKPVLLALGRLVFTGAGSRSMRLRLTAAGARALSRARGGAPVLALGEFVPTQGPPIVVQKGFRLRG